MAIIGSSIKALIDRRDRCSLPILNDHYLRHLRLFSEDLRSHAAFLHLDTYDTWLDPENQNTAALNVVLAERTLTEFECQPVSPRVNQVRKNDPENIKPVQIEFDI